MRKSFANRSSHPSPQPSPLGRGEGAKEKRGTRWRRVPSGRAEGVALVDRDFLHRHLLIVMIIAPPPGPSVGRPRAARRSFMSFMYWAILPWYSAGIVSVISFCPAAPGPPRRIMSL